LCEAWRGRCQTACERQGEKARFGEHRSRLSRRAKRHAHQPSTFALQNTLQQHLFRALRARIAAMTPERGSASGVFHLAEEANMKDAKTYREYAADCIRMAKLTNPKDKQALLKMAEAWEERAREADRQESKPAGS
jgi:hypothetical protein